jgi:hypothetical protein
MMKARLQNLPSTSLSKNATLTGLDMRQHRVLMPSVVQLQRDLGNQAIMRLFQSGAIQAKLTASQPDDPYEQEAGAGLTTAEGAIQTKLAINKPGDEYEQEADRVADAVVHMPEPQLQRVCACSGGCPTYQTEQPEQELERLQTKRVGSSNLGQTAFLPIVHSVLRSPAQPLDSATTEFFERRFGHDFHHVRVHTDAKAAESARAMNAQAYTVGRDLVFADEQYNPDTVGGRRLLAHELAHVVQQSPFENMSTEPVVQRACLPESECATPKGKPRVGSAKQFGEEMEKQEAPKRAEKQRQAPEVAQAGGHGRRAVEVEKLFQEHLPHLRPLIHGVFVDDTLPPDAGASHVDCLTWAEAALPEKADKTAFEGATHSCVVIPKQLEDNAKKYNEIDLSTLEPKVRDKLREDLNWFILRILTHEVTHERVKEANIAFPANQKCTKETLAKELGELAAVISEFPIVKKLAPDLRDAWANAYLKDPRQNPNSGESIFGSILDIRCSCECGDADALIRAAFEIASKSWTKGEELEFHAYMKRGKGKELGVYWPYDASRVGRVGRHEVSLTGGLAFSGSQKLNVALLTYRYVLWNWAEGRLRLTGGAQVNLAPLWESDSVGELGAATVGLQYLSTPVSREKTFGGLTGRLDTGFGLGEFSLRPVEPEAAGTTGRREDWILQVGGGVQFFIPRLTHLTPASLEAAYRLAQPLDPDAKRIHTVSVSASFQF